MRLLTTHVGCNSLAHRHSSHRSQNSFGHTNTRRHLGGSHYRSGTVGHSTSQWDQCHHTQLDIWLHGRTRDSGKIVSLLSAILIHRLTCTAFSFVSLGMRLFLICHELRWHTLAALGTYSKAPHHTHPLLGHVVTYLNIPHNYIAEKFAHRT